MSVQDKGYISIHHITSSFKPNFEQQPYLEQRSKQEKPLSARGVGVFTKLASGLCAGKVMDATTAELFLGMPNLIRLQLIMLIDALERSGYQGRISIVNPWTGMEIELLATSATKSVTSKSETSSTG